MNKVTEIKVEMVVNGYRKVAIWRGPDKVGKLLTDDGSLGSFLCDMRDETVDAVNAKQARSGS